MNHSGPPQFLPVHIRFFLIFTFVLLASVVTSSQTPAGPAPSPSDADAERPATNAVKPPGDAARASTEVAKPFTEASPTAAETIRPFVDPAKTAETLQTRIERARALIAAHRLDIAASELESVRATTQDNALRNITSIMLMNVYLEEGNYGRAEALLEENFKAHSAQKDDALGTFFALAGQAVNGARGHLARYRNFGISTTASNLPPEAASDLDRLRSLLERMVAQAKEISNARRAYDSLSLLEDVLGLRLSLAKDSEDQIKWQTEYVGARESLASSQTQIASLGGIPPLRPGKTPVKNSASPSPYSTKKTSESPLVVKSSDKDHTSAERPSANHTGASFDSSTQPAKGPQAITQASEAAAEQPQVTDVGALNEKATKKVVPRYPSLAKQNGAAGLVRVHVILDEAGKVIYVSRTEGPMLLRSAAEEAARQWTFEVAPTDGRPIRISGFIDFTFSL